MNLPFEISLYDGILLIDKPAGPTSHDVVDTVRSILGIQRVGHCGTLDPNATGLLIVVTGKGTKLSERFTATDKVYEGAMVLGIETDSYDADGEVVSAKPVPPLTTERLNEIAKKFTGDILQTPPMVSAVKKGGIPLYKLARKGVDVHRDARPIHIYDFTVEEYIQPMAWFRVACSKGTYVRSLVYDFGKELGCGAHLKHLRRTVSGKFTVDDAIELEELIKLPPKQLQEKIIPITEVVKILTLK